MSGYGSDKDFKGSEVWCQLHIAPFSLPGDNVGSNKLKDPWIIKIQHIFMSHWEEVVFSLRKKSRRRRFKYKMKEKESGTPVSS